MKTSDRGLDLIKAFESFQPKAYVCPGGVLTCGYGHTTGVTSEMTCDEERAMAWLREDLAGVEQAVSELVTVPLSQGEFDALVSFAFNCGVGSLARSTLLRLLNTGDRVGAVAQFGRWNRARGKVLAGLSRRRAAEAALFCGELL